MSDERDTAVRVATKIADRLATPEHARHLLPADEAWWPQSLAYGAAGIALLHIERARTGHGSWQRAHTWLLCASANGAETSERAHLYYGAPAIAFAIHAAANTTGGYQRALDRLDTAITAATRRRLQAAHSRIDVDHPPVLAEFDAIRGLAGSGAYLLARHSGGDLLREVLSYLVRLAEPRHDNGEELPGWWSHVSPSGVPSPDYPGGHANIGMAHGISGVLALLSLCLRRGIAVDGHDEAIARILSWFDQWRHDDPHAKWWPALLTRAQMRGEEAITGPHRPSWCYGTPGIARAQQLAALATKDTARQQAVEEALADTVKADALAMLSDTSLCHGRAGLAHLIHRAATDATTSDLTNHLPDLVHTALDGAAPHDAADQVLQGGDIGLLKGAAGTALALHTIGTGDLPENGWDTFLLIN